MNNNSRQKLAEITVKIGVNLQEHQKLVINAPLDCADFARILSKTAFEAGALDVMVNYSDQKLARIRYDHATTEVLTQVPDWQRDKYQYIIDEGAAIISIHAEDPTVLAGVDTTKVQAASNAIQKAAASYQQAITNSERRWCVISVPTTGWAKKVFPELEEAEAVESLWTAIFQATRTDLPDPVAAWTHHDAQFEEKCRFLNTHQFDTLVYKNNRGTNIRVGMPKNHLWSGGSEVAGDGISFFPNIPTEEIFCAPDKNRIDGTLVASHPLVYQGQLIDDFSLTFKAGQVVDYRAGVGLDALKSLVTANKGSDYLGEIALVPYDSPISNMDILFYNTLFDENASCHFALGSAYPMCVEGGQKMDEAQLEAVGLNTSMTHVDFMVGTEDLSIVGVDAQGNETPIFVSGNWA